MISRDKKFEPASPGGSEAGGEDLGALHVRLHEHFCDLRDSRSAIGAPVFALEHGLASAEVSLLCEVVVSAISEGSIYSDTWLPLVVYAAEIGYEFSGDEYWQTFESRTPGWTGGKKRTYLRQRFWEFKDLYGGAEPVGPWAEHFSIICWPITHAVLPADLQRHLARLLYEYRRALTSDLLADPEELGRHLAARAFHTSSRFQHFAQNVGLLGRVAASLLLGERDQSPFLLASTLNRILEDLSDERAARRWLHDARTAAARLRTRGFLPTLHSRGNGGEEGVVLAPLTDPKLSLQMDEGGWSAYMEVPDLSPLAGRFPEVADELGRRRAVLAGVAGPPIARGRLLYPGQRFRLDEWPPDVEPLLMVEGGESATNSILADQSVLPPGPWLFSLRAPGYATEVRSKQVRPGAEYILVLKDAPPPDLPQWAFGVAVETVGVHALELQVPSVIDEGHVASLRRMGIGVLIDLEVRPVGLVPASWDGEGQAEWLAGEDPVLFVTSTRRISKSIWVIDDQPVVIPWPDGQNQVFIEVGDLAIGRHQVLVSLFDPDNALVAEKTMVLDIRPPRLRPESGTGREGLVILATPVSPTLNELWDGEAAVEVRGPPGVEARIDFLLRDRSGAKLALVGAGVHLPVEAQDWAGLFDRIRGDESVQKVYDEVETCEIRVSHDDLGAVALRCERPFAALRWAAAKDGQGPFLRLIDNTEGNPVEISLYDFSSPDQPETVAVDEHSHLRFKPGGLAIASAGTISTAMILPPTVRHLGDFQPVPRLRPGRASLEGISHRIELAKKWGAASRSSNPFGEFGRVKVLRSITADMAGLIGGHQWFALERRTAEKEDVSEEVLLRAIGSKGHQRAVAHDVSRWTERLVSEPPQERAESFAVSLAAHARIPRYRSEDPRFAEFLLRLASAPDSLCGWDSEELSIQVQRVLQAPFLIRAARCLVLAIEARTSDGLPATFEGWAWR